MPLNIAKLKSIKNPLNSYLIEKDFNNVDKVFNRLVLIAENLPRTTVSQSEVNYWKGVSRSFIFRFPDELEILKINSDSIDSFDGKIQIRSASRLGQSDLGVNQRRVQYLLNQLDNI
tara:strand:- start:514 stop:864 length:351 start_codon:yes stop_codon:yes gene_type:complete